MIGSVMSEEHFDRARAQVHGRLLEGDVEGRHARLHDHGTYAIEKVMCADGHGGDAAAAGQPSVLHRTNKSSMDSPVITSGITKAPWSWRSG